MIKWIQYAAKASCQTTEVVALKCNYSDSSINQQWKWEIFLTWKFKLRILFISVKYDSKKKLAKFIFCYNFCFRLVLWQFNICVCVLPFLEREMKMSVCTLLVCICALLNYSPDSSLHTFIKSNIKRVTSKCFEKWQTKKWAR